MTNTEMIKDMLGRQKAFDTEVFKKHNYFKGLKNEKEMQSVW